MNGQNSDEMAGVSGDLVGSLRHNNRETTAVSREESPFLRRREPLSLRLPATSANLGPGFDAVALALALYLEVEAECADTFGIEASGRSPEVCSALAGNLLLDTYRDIWTRYGQGEPQTLRLTVRNGIPLGMGCGSSAASRLAAIALASHFAGLGWNRDRMLTEAAALEHHPDNVAACCLGGLAVAGTAPFSLPGSAPPSAPAKPPRVHALRFTPPPGWHALLVLPETSLATTVSRAVLPASYPRSEVVTNLQNLALLIAAFAKGEGSLLASATADRLHQPFRGDACPLLPRLLPLAGSDGVLSVTLSGAGSGVLLLLSSEAFIPEAMARVRAAASRPDLGPLPLAELLPCGLSVSGAKLRLNDPSGNPIT